MVPVVRRFKAAIEEGLAASAAVDSSKKVHLLA